MLRRLGVIAPWAGMSAAVIVLVVFAACNERRDTVYATLADAIAAGEVQRGWLPDWMPGRAAVRGIRDQGFEILTASEPDVGGRTRTVLCALNARTGAAYFDRTP